MPPQSLRTCARVPVPVLLLRLLLRLLLLLLRLLLRLLLSLTKRSEEQQCRNDGVGVSRREIFGEPVAQICHERCIQPHRAALGRGDKAASEAV